MSTKKNVTRSISQGSGGPGWHGPAGLALPNKQGRWSVVEGGAVKATNVSEDAALAIVSDPNNSFYRRS
jgi:hypothetical protein